MATQLKTKPARAKKIAPAVAPEQTKEEMATPTPRLVHTGTAPATYRVGKNLTALRHDYKVGTMQEKDHLFLKDVVALAGDAKKLPRRNIDAGRLGRLYTLQMVDYELIGVADPEQIISVLPKAYNFLKPVKAA